MKSGMPMKPKNTVKIRPPVVLGADIGYPAYTGNSAAFDYDTSGVITMLASVLANSVS